MGFSLRIGSMLVTADTAAEAADLVRALGATAPPVPPPAPPSEQPPAAVPIPPPAVASPDPIPDAEASPRGQRKWPISRGSIFRQQDRLVLEISIDGKADRRGSFKTSEDAERAQEETYQARLRGDPLPIYVWRRCRRCGVVGHTAVKCKAPEAMPEPASPPEGPSRHLATKEERSAAIKAGWTRRKAELAAARSDAPPQAPPERSTVRIGTPEYRARVGEGVRAAWARRRAARAEVVDGAPLPPAVVTPKLPPRCGRCFRVGHVEADCPTAAPKPDQATCAESQADPSCLTEQAAEQLGDGDEGTDLTDLVDVPDAEPTAIPDLDVGRCGGCGQIGHQSTSPLCPLSSEQEEERPPADRPRAEPRTRMPPSFTETPLTMHRHLHVIEPGAEPIDEQRPRTRGECQGDPRPCPWSGCRYHLSLDVLETGNLHRTFGDLDFAEMPETCALDIADRGGATLEEIGRALNVSRERIRQLETLALANAARSARRLHLVVEFPDEPRSNAPEDTL